MQSTKLLFILLLLLTCCEEQDAVPVKEKLPKIGFTTLGSEPKLSYAIKNIGAIGSKAGKIASYLRNIKTDSILKVLQSDSSSYSFTIRLRSEDQELSFKNLVFRRTLNGFIAFIVEYESADGKFDLTRFTGTVRKYDLEDKLLQELHLKSGSLETTNGGRTASCSLVGFSKTCNEEIFDGWDQSTGAPIYRCNAYTIFITFDCQDDYNGSSGYGTYIADYSPGGGGGTGSSGSGNYDPDTEFSTFDEGDPIGVNPEPTISRAIELQGLLLQSPSLLLEVPCAQLPKWQTLVQYRPGQVVRDKLLAVKNKFSIGDVALQAIQNASGEVVNLDYFPVTINTLPKNPTTGKTFTATEFLNYIRTHINEFINTSVSSFSPSTITGFSEAQIWNSSNPLGAVIHIDIGGGAGDGSVICSSINSNSWTFSTIEVPYNPFSQEYDGQHPVSGNREFGFSQNTNGSYTFYTRGVDRITDALDATVAKEIVSNPFENPDALWNSFKSGIYNFTQSHSGNAIAPIPSENQIYRPDWNKVKEVLLGHQPISSLGCR